MTNSGGIAQTTNLHNLFLCIHVNIHIYNPPPLWALYRFHCSDTGWARISSPLQGTKTVTPAISLNTYGYHSCRKWCTCIFKRKLDGHLNVVQVSSAPEICLPNWSLIKTHIQSSISFVYFMNYWYVCEPTFTILSSEAMLADTFVEVRALVKACSTVKAWVRVADWHHS